LTCHDQVGWCAKACEQSDSHERIFSLFYSPPINAKFMKVLRGWAILDVAADEMEATHSFARANEVSQ
jgi:hypothetical protein